MAIDSKTMREKTKENYVTEVFFFRMDKDTKLTFSPKPRTQTREEQKDTTWNNQRKKKNWMN